jgi:alkylated DNA repair dioxygenase AlkB
MAKQKQLFGEPEDRELIPGLTYLPDYITPQQEGQLIAAIDRKEWLEALRRRVQQYGYEYNYRSRNLLKAENFPRWANNFSDKLVRDEIYENRPDQLIVNEYDPGQGITDHIDHEEHFGEPIVSLSLGSAVVMQFKQARRKTKELLLEPRSLVILSGDARQKWTHGIPSRKTDKIDGETYKRDRRISLTFRSLQENTES